MLADLGYANLADRLGIDDVAGVLKAETWTGVGGSETATAGVMVDLHWQLPGSEASPEAAWEAMTRWCNWVELDGRRVPTLAAEGLALHLATHAAQHGPRHEQPMEDLAKGLDRWSPDVWRAAARLAAEIEATEAFGAGLRLVPQGAALAGELGLPATDGLEWSIANRAARPRGTFHLQAFEAGTVTVGARLGAPQIPAPPARMDRLAVPLGTRNPSADGRRPWAAPYARTGLGRASVAFPAPGPARRVAWLAGGR